MSIALITEIKSANHIQKIEGGLLACTAAYTYVYGLRRYPSIIPSILRHYMTIPSTHTHLIRCLKANMSVTEQKYLLQCLVRAASAQWFSAHATIDIYIFFCVLC